MLVTKPIALLLGSSLFAICVAGIVMATNPSDVEIRIVPSANESRSDYDDMMSVVMHQRCMNCHPQGDRPSQGEDSHEHYFEVQRGEDGHGVAANRCETCHREENNDWSGVPGAPHWHLAPLSMGWQSLAKNEVAKAMLDPSKNGGRSLEDIRKHMTEDALVLWVFEPGVNAEGIPREAPPIAKEQYIAAVNAWAKAGGSIPKRLGD